MAGSMFTAEQKRDLVYEYVGVPYGAKTDFLHERGLRKSQMRVWRTQVFADTMHLGLIPRGGSVVSMEESAALARLLKENESLQRRLQEQQAEHEKAIAARDAEVATQRRAVDALGKAIEILHEAGAGKNSRRSGATSNTSDKV